MAQFGLIFHLFYFQVLHVGKSLGNVLKVTKEITFLHITHSETLIRIRLIDKSLLVEIISGRLPSLSSPLHPWSLVLFMDAQGERGVLTA